MIIQLNIYLKYMEKDIIITIHVSFVPIYVQICITSQPKENEKKYRSGELKR